MDPIQALGVLPLSPAPPELQGPKAGPPTEAQLKDAAEQFEAIFVRQLLRDLRKTASLDGESSSMTGIYTEMFDERLADQIAKSGGIGLAGVIRAYVERGGR